MPPISTERLTVSPDRSFVVFLIGARANRWWQLPVVWGVNLAMARMLRELSANPGSGLLSYEVYVGRTSLMVQYWRSLDDLQRYARDRERAHVPAWRNWIRKWAPTAAVGIWHETYLAGPGTYETVYHHMPPFGLARALPRIPANGTLKTAPGRLATGRQSGIDKAPVTTDGDGTVSGSTPPRFSYD